MLSGPVIGKQICDITIMHRHGGHRVLSFSSAIVGSFFLFSRKLLMFSVSFLTPFADVPSKCKVEIDEKQKLPYRHCI